MATPTDQWDTIINAQLAAMSCAQLQPGQGFSVVQIVMFPAFHAVSCFVIDERQHTTELSLIILQNKAGIDKRIEEPRHVWSDIVELPLAYYQPLREQIASLEPQALTDDVLQTRDGIIVRYQFLRAGAVHNRWMLNPRFSGTADDLRLIQMLLMLARDAFGDSTAQSYLAQLHHWYFRT